MAKVTIPYDKIRQLVVTLSGQLWDDEWKEIKRIIEGAPADERVIQVSFAHTIDCTGELPCIKTKISFSEKFSATATASVDEVDPNQPLLTLDGSRQEQPAPTVDEAVAALGGGKEPIAEDQA